jgi:hypothetical protein
VNRYRLIPAILSAAVGAIPGADAAKAGEAPKGAEPSTGGLPAGHYLCAAGVSDVEGSYLDTRELTLQRDRDAVVADTKRGITLTGKLVDDRLYLIGSDIDDSGLEVIQVVAKVDGDTAAGDFIRTLDGRVIARGQFLMRRAEGGS